MTKNKKNDTTDDLTDHVSKVCVQEQNTQDTTSTHESEILEYKNNYYRALADYQNLLKRVEREREEYTQFANERLLMKILAVSDDLEYALKHTKEEGIRLIYSKLEKILESEGVQKIAVSETESYNPETMECVQSEDQGTRLIVTRNGYTKNGKILRPVQVKVAK